MMALLKALFPLRLLLNQRLQAHSNIASLVIVYHDAFIACSPDAQCSTESEARLPTMVKKMFQATTVRKL